MLPSSLTNGRFTFLLDRFSLEIASEFTGVKHVSKFLGWIVNWTSRASISGSWKVENCTGFLSPSNPILSAASSTISVVSDASSMRPYVSYSKFSFFYRDRDSVERRTVISSGCFDEVLTALHDTLGPELAIEFVAVSVLSSE